MAPSRAAVGRVSLAPMAKTGEPDERFRAVWIASVLLTRNARPSIPMRQRAPEAAAASSA